MSSSSQDRWSFGDQPLEDLVFRPSAAGTVGVELELQILDRDTGELTPGALRILDVCADEGIDGVVGELLLSMLEIKTGICQDVGEVGEVLFPRFRRVRHVAGSLGYDLAVAGTHPFSRCCTSAIYPNERYRRIHKEQGWLANYETVFGLHIHVGVPDGDTALGLVNLLTPYLPHLLALSSSSPFWHGVDTSFASARAALFRPSPFSGIPQPFAGWQDFVHYCQVLHSGGAITATKELYWDIVPRPLLGTIEFRICDAPASPALLLGLTALVRALVLDGLALLGERGPCPPLGRESFWLAQHNRTRAARYGLRAECVRTPGAPAQSLAEDSTQLVQQLLAVAAQQGEDRFLAALLPDRFESGAERQRRLYRQTGSWQAVIDDLRRRWPQEMDDLSPLPMAAAFCLSEPEA